MKFSLPFPVLAALVTINGQDVNSPGFDLVEFDGFDTTTGCEDVCPVSKPDWQNDTECDSEALWICDCVYDGPS